MGLDDSDATTHNAYLAWLAERHKHTDLEVKDNTNAEGCFASAIAVLLGAGPAEEARLKSLLDRRYEEFMRNGANTGQFQGDLPQRLIP